MSAAAAPVRLLLSDVDGTLVTTQKRLSERAVDAVRRLHQAGVLFAVTSGRPPRGMRMLIEPLGLTLPMAAFNGGLVVDREMVVLEQRTIPGVLVAPIVERMEEEALDVWVYRGADWLVRDLRGRHVAREAMTVQFEPVAVESFEAIAEGVVKVMGVSDDHAHLAAVSRALHDEFGAHVCATRSQPYYLDVTHPEANKGRVVRDLSARYGIAEKQIATIGDMPNDGLMFARSGLSIAMGQSDREVQRAARRVTA